MHIEPLFDAFESDTFMFWAFWASALVVSLFVVWCVRRLIGGGR